MFYGGVIMNAHPSEFLLRCSTDAPVLVTLNETYKKMKHVPADVLWEVCRDALTYDYFNMANDEENSPPTYAMYTEIFKNLSTEESIVFCLAAKQARKFLKDILIVA